MTMVVAVLILTGCATLGGMFIGMGIGAMTGNAAMGAAVGASSGMVIDIFAR
jgi:uncharacterized membrane protein